MRLLVFYPHNPKNHVMYMRLFADTLAQKGHMVYGPGRDGYVKGSPAKEIVSKYGPFDAVLAIEPKWLRWLTGMTEIKIPKAIVLSDYFPRKKQWDMTRRRLDQDGYDLVFAQTLYELEAFKKNKNPEQVRYLPMSVDTNYFQDLGMKRDIDIMASWCTNITVYPMRRDILSFLEKLPFKNHLNPVVFNKYVLGLNRSKIFINSGTIFGNIQSRFAEVAACGCLLLTDRATDMQTQGWSDNENLALYDGSIDDLQRKLIFYLSHDDERKKIAETGRDFVRACHSNDVRTQEVIEIMRRI